MAKREVGAALCLGFCIFILDFVQEAESQKSWLKTKQNKKHLVLEWGKHSCWTVSRRTDAELYLDGLQEDFEAGRGRLCKCQAAWSKTECTHATRNTGRAQWASRVPLTWTSARTACFPWRQAYLESSVQVARSETFTVPLLRTKRC